MKKEIKPVYYDEFICTAGACPMTCCQEWNIAVDDATLKKWKKMKLDGSEPLSSFAKKQKGGYAMELNKEHKCPFLKEDGLCKLVTKFGEGALSETCHTFPRQEHEYFDRKERSLVSCCPAVIDIWKDRKKVEFTVDLNTLNEGFLFQVRTVLMNIINKFKNNEGLMIAFYFLSDLLEEEAKAKQLIEEYQNEENLNKIQKAIKNMEFHFLDTFLEDNELFLDLCQNYRKQKLYVPYLEEISVYAQELEKKFEQNTDLEQEISSKGKEFQKEYSQYENLFKNYLVAELFTNSLLPETGLFDLVMMFQWIAMEYSMMRHALFLRWMLKGESLDYPMVRDYMVVISRMTGYNAEDIYEYLENSFQDVIWEWGYFALVVGEEK